MSVAVGTPTGLVVPVLRNAENMSFAQVRFVLRCVASASIAAAPPSRSVLRLLWFVLCGSLRGCDCRF